MTLMAQTLEINDGKIIKTNLIFDATAIPSPFPPPGGRDK